MKTPKIFKRINISYTARFLMVFLIAGLLVGIGSLWFQLNKVNNQNQQEITDIREALVKLENYAKTGELDEDGKPYIHIELEQSAIDMEDMGDILTIVQNQNAQTSRDLSNQITMFSIILTIVVLAIPLFNYRFLQKDQIERLNKQYDEFTTRFENELDRLRNSVDQSSKVTEALANPKEESPDITPISDSVKDKARAYYLEASLLSGKEEYEKALANLNKAIELEPKIARYYNSRGTVLEDLKRYDEALKDMTKAIELKPKDAFYYWSRGNILKKLKRFDEALKDVTTAIELDPNNAGTYWHRGSILDELERLDEALKDMTKAIEIEPNDADTYWYRGLILEKLERLDEALKDMTKAIELNPNDATYYSARGSIFERLDRYEEALKDITKANELEPNDEFYIKRRNKIQQILKALENETD